MPVQCTCRQCGREIRIRPSRYRPETGNFCSEACRGAYAKVAPAESTCQRCGVTFALAAWRVAKGEGQYCSRACRDYHAHRAQRDPSNGIAVACPECGAVYKAWKFGRVRKYCSQRCAGAATVSNIPTWAPSAFTAACEQCEQEYQTTPKATRGRFCSRACWGLWLRDNAPAGEESPNWRGGYEPYYGPSWRPARRAARARDGVCRDCGISPSEHGKSLDVHHLAPFRTFGVERHLEANELANLVTLCPRCHSLREWATNWKRE